MRERGNGNNIRNYSCREGEEARWEGEKRVVDNLMRRARATIRSSSPSMSCAPVMWKEGGSSRNDSVA